MYKNKQVGFTIKILSVSMVAAWQAFNGRKMEIWSAQKMTLTWYLVTT